MQYGICHLSIVPLRFESSDKSELVSQLLYGDHFKIIEKRKHWSKIRLAFDSYEGWIDNKQYQEIDENQYKPKLVVLLILGFGKPNSSKQVGYHSTFSIEGNALKKVVG